MSYIQAGYTPPNPPKKPKERTSKASVTENPSSNHQANANYRGNMEPQPKPPRIKKPKKQRTLSQKVFIGLVCTLLTLTIGLVVFVAVASNHLTVYNETFYPGVYVGGVHLGGLSPEQATTALNSSVSENLKDWSISASYNGVTIQTFTADDLGVYFNLRDQLTDAWQVARSGSLFNRLFTYISLESTPVVFSTAVSYDEEKLSAIVKKVASDVFVEAVDATSAFNPESDTPFTFTDETIGKQLDVDDLTQKLKDSIESLSTQTFELKVDDITPTVLRSDLANNISLRSMVTSTIATTSAEGRNQNIEIATIKVNGLIIQPGERVSFNKAIGKRTEGNGYTTALELAYGEYVEGIGGGVCQVSTAVYQALLRAGIEVVERYPHAIPSSYAEMGQDATISDQGLDLVFKNTTSTPLYFKARVVKSNDIARRIEVSIFGGEMEERYTLQSTVTEELTLEPVYIKDKQGRYVTYEGQEQQVTEGRMGYVVETYRVTTTGGVTTEKELISTDTYPASAPQIYVGVTR